jgi:hypothetical protein
MRFCVSLLSIAAFFVAGCDQQGPVNYGFSINNVNVNRAYQSLNVRLQQDLELSEQAREALEHGVTLTVVLEMELRNENNMIVAKKDSNRFQISYLPLSERYQLASEKTGGMKTYPRLRHWWAAMDDLDVPVSTGPLPPGSYELRVRVRLDERSLPAPMQLPAWFSSQWRHDSEWSVWPFEISA